MLQTTLQDEHPPARLVAGALAHLARHMTTGCPRAAAVSTAALQAETAAREAQKGAEVISSAAEEQAAAAADQDKAARDFRSSLEFGAEPLAEFDTGQAEGEGDAADDSRGAGRAGHRRACRSRSSKRDSLPPRPDRAGW